MCDKKRMRECVLSNSVAKTSDENPRIKSYQEAATGLTHSKAIVSKARN